MSSSGIPRAGMIYNLTCTVSKIRGLINSPIATWTTGGVAVISRNGITISVNRTGTATLSTLTFNPLRTFQNGRYSCNGTLVSPALDSSLVRLIEKAVSVQSNISIFLFVIYLLQP